MSLEVLKSLFEAVTKAKNEIRDIGGSNCLRGNLGTEAHFRWLTMYYLQPLLPEGYLQSLEVKPLSQKGKH
jgi:hypothetical protein